MLNKEHARKISPALFGCVALFFLFPFVTFSCMGQEVFTLTGLELVTGKTVEMPNMGMGEEPERERVGPSKFAIGAILVALVGCLVALRKLGLPPAIFGVAGAVLLLALKFQIDHDVSKKAEEEGIGTMFTVEYGMGYWLALLAFIGAAVFNFIMHSQAKKQAEAASETLFSQEPPPPPESPDPGSGVP